MARLAQPPHAVRLVDQPSRYAEARQAGLHALDRGEVAVAVVAGGQGTRLGFDKPKGLLSIGPVSGRSLFEFIIDQVVARTQRHRQAIPLLIMTSPATDEATREYFDASPSARPLAGQIEIFCQGTMPVLHADSGRLLMDSKHSIATSPDGHGGMLQALHRTALLETLQQRGIRYLYYCQVDNPLCKVADPMLLGWHIVGDAEATLEAVSKIDPLQRVGNIVALGDKTFVIEYSDLPADIATERIGDGSLRLWAGSIAVHVFNVDLLIRISRSADGLPFHIAHKKATYVDENGKLFEPDSPNAIKFERFIFDILPQAERTLVVEVDADESFAAVKNATGAAFETKETAQQAISQRTRRWLRAAGAEVCNDKACEIHPAVAMDEDDLRRFNLAGEVVKTPCYIDQQWLSKLNSGQAKV